MSEQKLISPLLDGFAMGNPMSDHDGVRCCPAIKENTDKKYIVKIITVPASQVQLDAFLLAGAYKDPADVMDYYKEQAEDIAREAELLQKLSRLEGFLPYDLWQIEPITKRRLGYEVYLLSSYKRSLEKHMHRNPVSHLEAFNMSIDICSALSVCRQAGFLYVDLKPSNIFMSEQKEYRIGDLGFLSLDALRYTTLPTKYHSAYTPPEFEDPMAPLNATADTYALGMILYQLYNDGQLPSREDIGNGTVPSPANADYELAEIIMTAIHANPESRWQTPGAMGQALISYMQRNAVNDVPITPYIPLETEPETEVPQVQTPAETPVDEPIDVSVDEAAEESAEKPTEESAEEAPEEPVVESAGESVEEPDNREAISDPAVPEEIEVFTEPKMEEPEVPKDDSVPGEEDADLLQPHEMSEELSKIVAKADDLISHETPEGVILPEIPEPPDPFAFAADDMEEPDDTGIPLDPLMDEPPEKPEKPAKKKKKKKSRRFVSPEQKRKVKRFFTTLLFLVALAAVGFCGYLYYQMFYLQSVNALTINGTDNSMTVKIDTEADESLLQVICTDSYGNVRKSGVSNGTAAFQDLLPGTEYTIALKINGYHKLSGETSTSFTTDANTNIVSFTAVNGSEDGSFVLNFTVDGEEPDEWSVICSADGEEDHRQTFTGHSVTVKNLTVGKRYTFTLMTEDNLAVSGMTTIECIAARLILAENIAVSSENGTDMTISWTSPGDVIVDSWNVRVYNNRGFEVQFTVDETQALIPGVDLSTGYTIEITAAGMTNPARASITKDPINITQFTLNDTQAHELQLSWQSSETPKGGWLLMYTVDGALTPSVVKCDTNSAVIAPKIPGAKYRFVLQAASGTSVINQVYTYASPAAEDFVLHGLSKDSVTANLLKTPEEKGWRYDSISDDDFTDTFAVGDKISVVLRTDSSFYLPGNETRIVYVFRDMHGNAISDLCSQEKVYWKNIWSGGDAKAGELNIPTTLTTAGEYLLDICIDGMLITQLSLTVN